MSACSPLQAAVSEARKGGKGITHPITLLGVRPGGRHMKVSDLPSLHDSEVVELVFGIGSCVHTMVLRVVGIALRGP